MTLFGFGNNLINNQIFNKMHIYNINRIELRDIDLAVKSVIRSLHNL